MANCWHYKNHCIKSEDIPEESIGYIYKITNTLDDSIYIGKKNLSFARKTKISKREQEATNNRRKKFKIVVKESDWQNYYGSSKKIDELRTIFGDSIFKREILLFVKTKADLTYWEVYYQFQENVLFTDSMNISILGRFFKGKINKYN